MATKKKTAAAKKTTPSRTIGILVEKDYQDLEVWYPYLRLLEAGYKVVTIGVDAKQYQGKYGYPIECSTTVGKIKSQQLEGLIIPGGWAPDHLRKSKEVLKLVKTMNKEGKLIAAICHGGWVLASAEILEGRSATSYVAIKDDLKHAGANWVDKEVVVDGNLVTSRTPWDLPAFMIQILEILQQAENSQG